MKTDWGPDERHDGGEDCRPVEDDAHHEDDDPWPEDGATNHQARRNEHPVVMNCCLFSMAREVLPVVAAEKQPSHQKNQHAADSPLQDQPVAGGVHEVDEGWCPVEVHTNPFFKGLLSKQ